MLMSVGILAHEGIHALAWTAFGRLPIKRIRVDFHASTPTPDVRALDPMLGPHPGSPPGQRAPVGVTTGSSVAGRA